MSRSPGARTIPRAGGLRPRRGGARDRRGRVRQRERAAARELQWSCYAWPLEYGWTAKRAFFINQSGDTLVTVNQEGRFSGHEHPPSAGLSALLPCQDENVCPKGAANEEDALGMRWTVIR